MGLKKTLGGLRKEAKDVTGGVLDAGGATLGWLGDFAKGDLTDKRGSGKTLGPDQNRPIALQGVEKKKGINQLGINKLPNKDIIPSLNLGFAKTPALSPRDIVGGIADFARENWESGGAFMGDVTPGVRVPKKASIPSRVKANLPGPVSIVPGEEELLERPGVLLKLRGERQLAPDYGIDAIYAGKGVAEDAARQVDSASTVLMSEANTASRNIPTFKAKDGNLYVKGVAASPTDLQHGLPGAPLVRVIERPSEYTLPPNVKAAVDKYGDIARSVKDERNIFGAAVDELNVKEGDQFFWRAAKETKKGKLKPRGSGGSRLGGGKDKTRFYDDPAEAIAKGVVYDDPTKVVATKAHDGLKKAADAHIASLLKPLGETSSMRMPPALRQQWFELKAALTSLRASGELLTKKQGMAIDAALQADDPNLDGLAADLAGMAIKRGKFKGAVAGEVRGMREQVQQRLDALRPEWNKAKSYAQQTPQGQAMVSRDLAPALSNYTFDEDVAKRITSYYERGKADKVSGKLRAINHQLIPLKATLDYSATFINNLLTAPSHPLTFAKNFGKSFMRDQFRGAAYDRYIATKGRDAAAHGVAILSETGTNEFQFTGLLSKIPIIAQTNKFFARFNNRMRIDLFNQSVDLAARKGQPLDSLAKEQLARGLNRATGISTSKASDYETFLMFAPNFFRSQIENIAEALTTGGIEGQLARQYFMNIAATGSGLVTATALYQGRDLNEVLNPLDPKGLRSGDIRPNPNFMSVRVAGQDIKVFGQYDSLVRLAFVAGQATTDAVNKRDYRELFDFVGYAASTKGNPFVGFMTDVIKGETFTGRDPLSFTAWVERFAPFGIGNAMEAQAKGLSGTDTFIGGGVGSTGLKTSAISVSERKDEIAKRQYNRNYWDELTGEEQDEAMKANPDLAERDQRALEASNDPASQAKLRKQERDEGRMADERALNTALQAGRLDPKTFDDKMKELMMVASAQDKEYRLAVDQEFRDPKSIQGKALAGYYALFEKYQIAPGVMDWEAFEKAESDYMSSLTAEQRRYVDERRRPLHAQEVDWYFNAKNAIAKAGYYDMVDEVYADLRDASMPRTYNQLVQELNLAIRQGDTDRIFELRDAKLFVDKFVGQERQMMRLDDPNLDAALAALGRVVPIDQQAPRRGNPLSAGSNPLGKGSNPLA